MMERPTSLRNRGRTAVDGAMALIVLLLIVQVWLLTATLDAFLAGHRDVAIPGAVVSGLLFLGCFGLYLFVIRLERVARKRLP
jgi:predicted Co/Zn/Cd cation transporter (cation efflux family)